MGIRWPFSRRRSPSLDSVRLDWSELRPGGEPEPGRVRVWTTPAGDPVGLFFFAVPPDLPSTARSMPELAAFYRERAGADAIVDVARATLDRCPAVRVVVKSPQVTLGTTYVGSLTVPFREFAFVVKVHCEERGMTGIREAVLLDERLAAGERGALGATGRLDLPGFDPDAPEHDARFPDHPLSRARGALARLERAVSIDADVRALPRFPLPP